MQKIASFEVNYLQYLSEDSKPSNDMPGFVEDQEELVKLYNDMQFLRLMDNRAIALQRTGKMRTYPASTGQEGVGVGAGSCLTEKDVLVPYYRGTGMMMGHGVKPHEILMYWGGDERGSDFQDPKARQDFPIAVPIGTQCLHAAGIGAAMKYRGEKGRAVLTEIGEGGTSEGEFYEAINVAGVWDLPVVFVVNNNQWAISVPPSGQTKCETFAQKGIAAGIECVQVDGNDVIAVKDAVGRALDKARNGDGPTLIEAITYRLCDHTTADDASRYSDGKVRDSAWEKEPLIRLRNYLISLGACTQGDMDAFETKCKKELEEEVKIYLDYMENKKQPPEAMFDYLFEKLPEKFHSQREEVIRRAK